MSGPNGALVPGPGGNHHSAQNNQMVDNDLQNQTGGQGNLGRGFDQGSMGQGFEQGNLGTGFDSNTGSGSYGSQVSCCLEHCSVLQPANQPPIHLSYCAIAIPI